MILVAVHPGHVAMNFVILVCVWVCASGDIPAVCVCAARLSACLLSGCSAQFLVSSSMSELLVFVLHGGVSSVQNGKRVSFAGLLLNTHPTVLVHI